MSLSKADQVEMGMIRKSRLDISLTYTKELANDHYEGLIEGARRAEVELHTGAHSLSTSLTFIPRKPSKASFGGSFRTLFRKNPYATLHTPKFSILLNL